MHTKKTRHINPSTHPHTYTDSPTPTSHRHGHMQTPIYRMTRTHTYPYTHIHTATDALSHLRGKRQGAFRGSLCVDDLEQRRRLRATMPCTCPCRASLVRQPYTHANRGVNIPAIDLGSMMHVPNNPTRKVPSGSIYQQSNMAP